MNMGVSKSGTLHDMCKDMNCAAREQAEIVKRFKSSLTAQGSGLVKRLCKTCFDDGTWPH